MSRLVRFRSVKPELRILGVDDGGFAPKSAGETDVVGVVFRGGYWLDGVMKTKLTVDGLDATDRIAQMVRESPHYNQIRVIMLNSITLAGFNVVDMKKLFALTNLPIIVVAGGEPNLDGVKEASRNLPNWESRWEAVQNAGEITRVEIRGGMGTVYLQTLGISKKDADLIVARSSTLGSLPEPLRVARIIASGLGRVQVVAEAADKKV